MAKLKCPNGCKKAGWRNAVQEMTATGSMQKATCAGCGTVVTSTTGVKMNKVQDMTQTKE